MKKIFITALAFLGMGFSQAQNITDALRYSTESLSGTARYRGMSGAFGALGGDISAMSMNPAGSAVFLNSYSTVTLNYNNRRNSTSYFNGFNANRNSDVNFEQAGAVLVFNSTNPDNRFGKFTIGVNYAQTNNFDDNFLARGIGSTSIDSYFLNYANGIPLELLETIENETITDLYLFLGENEGFGAQQAFLGYQGYIIDPVSNTLDNTSYTSTIAPGSFDQSYSYAATGLNGKFTFNFASEFEDFLYMGANLNAHFLNYDRSTRLLERNSNAGSETNEVIFGNNLSTTGSGFSLQVGTIAKLSDNFRLGVTYDTPTWYTINERATQRLETFSNEFDERVVVNPNVVNSYPDYNLKTPGKLTGSLAVLFGPSGLLSFDYSYKDYSSIELRPAGDPEFMFQNSIIADNLRAASTYRIGGEYRISNWSLRGGYRFEESPYVDETTIGDLTGYSAGLGYNFGNIKIDLAYDNASRTDNPQLYQVGLTNRAGIDRDFTNVILSLSFGL
ncbi:transporter [Antarcticibacterium flavum]|uniref:Transporter n=1 Tax=Antarcticibacterium flavum TaxID=2058175 RepID=A0A5B7X182_9FLAO|nr:MULTISPECIES: outer membrane protein transport protein [Antarcticibacterium]MCM4161524.1 transporter [Antarcticibacterium sp. W02-3]QCY69127.1 transporter [Antarcticibacterium flavum]